MFTVSEDEMEGHVFLLADDVIGEGEHEWIADRDCVMYPMWPVEMRSERGDLEGWHLVMAGEVATVVVPDEAFRGDEIAQIVGLADVPDA